jgi:hypothetical protein
MEFLFEEGYRHEQYFDLLRDDFCPGGYPRISLSLLFPDIRKLCSLPRISTNNQYEFLTDFGESAQKYLGFYPTDSRTYSAAQ